MLWSTFFVPSPSDRMWCELQISTIVCWRASTPIWLSVMKTYLAFNRGFDGFPNNTCHCHIPTLGYKSLFLMYHSWSIADAMNLIWNDCSSNLSYPCYRTTRRRRLLSKGYQGIGKSNYSKIECSLNLHFFSLRKATVYLGYVTGSV